jgi:hypothetical protein
MYVDMFILNSQMSYEDHIFKINVKYCIFKNIVACPYYMAPRYATDSDMLQL